MDHIEHGCHVLFYFPSDNHRIYQIAVHPLIEYVEGIKGQSSLYCRVFLERHSDIRAKRLMKNIGVFDRVASTLNPTWVRFDRNDYTRFRTPPQNPSIFITKISIENCIVPFVGTNTKTYHGKIKYP